MITRKLVSKASLLLACGLISLPIYAGQVLDKIIAVVNSDVISKSELDNYTKLVVADMRSNPGAVLPPENELREQILNRMILDKIQVQLAEYSGIEIDSLTVSQALQNMAKQQGKSMEQFRRDVEKRGISFDEYRDLIRTELLVQRLQAREVGQDIAISKSDIESYMSSAAGQDKSGVEYRLAHILLTTSETPTPEALKRAQAQAEELVASLKNGADFAKTAMAKSAGRQALHGGDLGWRTAGEMPTLFVNYVPTMKVGDIVGPIRSAGGFHIIKLQEKRTSNNDANVETHVRHILISPSHKTSSQEAATQLALLRKKILNGDDFAKIAQQKSHDARSAAKGGDMGWVDEKSVLPAFYQVMAKLKNNEISEPFETEEGWNLIQVLDRRTQLTSNEAAWNRAVEVLTARKTNEALEAWTKRIRDEARVEILSTAANNTKKKA